MKNLPSRNSSSRLIILWLGFFLALAAHADQNLAGNVTVTGGSSTGNLSVTGAIDSAGNAFSFGTQGGSFGGSLLYQDNDVDTFTFGVNRTPASWLWQHNSAIKAMRLDSSHQLLLFNAAGTTAGITLTPVTSQISLGTATLTGSGTALTAGGAFTVGGTLTAQSSVINNGAITGGSTGLNLGAGGVDQNISLTPSGSGSVVLNGNVGIGTAPSGYFRLEVLGVPKFFPAAGGNNYVLLGAGGQTTGGSGVVLGYNQTYNGTAMGNAAYLQAESQGVAYRNLLLSPLGGNVGIGTTSPAYRLQVNGGTVGVTGSGASLVIAPDSSSGGAAALILQSLNAQTTGGSVVYMLSGVNNGNFPTSGSSLGGLDFRNLAWGQGASILSIATQTHTASVSGANLIFSTTGNGSNTASERLRIEQNGNVGVGTTSPQFKLDVTTSSPTVPLALTNTTTNGYSGFNLFDASGGSSVLKASVVYANSAAGTFPNTLWLANRGTAAGNDIVFATNNITEQMRITFAGNVGIGTTNPTQKLSVNGTIRAKEIIVDTGWADYVFDESYRLAPLAEVEAHIKSKKHLPGIPSAAEIAEHGVSMGDMQSRLLAKIEELTLRQIAQEKQINAQTTRLGLVEEENSALKTRLQSLDR